MIAAPEELTHTHTAPQTPDATEGQDPLAALRALTGETHTEAPTGGGETMMQMPEEQQPNAEAIALANQLKLRDEMEKEAQRRAIEAHGKPTITEPQHFEQPDVMQQPVYEEAPPIPPQQSPRIKGDGIFKWVGNVVHKVRVALAVPGKLIKAGLEGLGNFIKGGDAVRTPLGPPLGA